MTKSKKIISEFFKPYFKKYPQMEDIWFLIYYFDDSIHLADEDCGINGVRWDELSDEKMCASSCKIQNAIESLKESKVDVANIIEDLDKLVLKLQKEADDSNPLNEVINNVWNEDSREKLTKKVAKHLAKEIPWRYVRYCRCDVNEDGSVEIEEFAE